MKFLAVGLIALLTIWATRSRAVVPGRAQSLAEVFYRTKPAASARTGGSDPS
jgi:F0F1-type ATP synthase membrane subunit a